MAFTVEDYKAVNIVAHTRGELEAELEAVRERFKQVSDSQFAAEVNDDPMMAFAHASEMGVLQAQYDFLNRALEAKTWGDKINSGDADFQDLIRHIFG